MQPGNYRNFRASLNASNQECRKALAKEECKDILAEYYELARSSELSEEQFGKMQEILAMAESNDAMSLLINELDEITFQELGFYDEDYQSQLENEISRVQEFVLSETERRLLVPSAVEKPINFMSHKIASNYYPRVEMLLEPSCAGQLELRGKFLHGDPDAILLVSKCGSSGLQQDNSDQGKSLPCNLKGLAYNLFIEESVSLFAVSGLALLVLLLLI